MSMITIQYGGPSEAAWTLELCHDQLGMLAALIGAVGPHGLELDSTSSSGLHDNLRAVQGAIRSVIDDIVAAHASAPPPEAPKLTPRRPAGQAQSAA